MGLLFILPVSENETDRVSIEDQGKKIILKSYGLPLVFWSYLAAIIGVIGVMFLIVKDPIFKLMAHEDPINSALAIIVLVTMFGIPATLLGVFFYEKSLTKKGKELIVTHKVFWIPIKRKIYSLGKDEPLLVAHHMESPNVAKLKNEEGTRGFQNQGYFQLLAELEDGQTIFIDRHARKADLEKIKNLLNNY